MTSAIPEIFVDPSGEEPDISKLITLTREKMILKPIDLQNLLSSQEAKNFLQEDNTTIGCIDGRVLPEGCLGLAGSGILLPRDPQTDLPQEKYMKILEGMVREGKLTTLTWHRGHGGCGAAGIYLRKTGHKNPSEGDIARAAEEFAERLGAELERRTGKVVNVFEAQAPGHHNESVAYVDLTNRLDLEPESEPDKKLPNGFMINPRLTNDFDYTLEEIKVAISISFGSHGKGPDAFTPKNPYLVMLVDYEGNPMPINGFAEKIQAMIDSDFSQHKDKIKIQTANTVAN